ncbi:MAG: 50S ribosomal protein L3 [Patescibacteria group bacterium]|nr:50S ribosomal protein L3 [Patescibacteria group bacterium]
MKAILGRKVGMTHVYNDKGEMIPVTVVEAGPCFITQIRTLEKDGYSAIQIGFEETKKIKKPQEGHLAKLNKKLRFLKEARLDREVVEVEKEGKKAEYKVGDEIKADIFQEGDSVKIIGTSKGKGFAGVIKRHNFHRGPMSHGSHHHRAPGSIGAMFPQHVFKGTKLSGRMGHARSTVKSTKVVSVDAENNMIALKGAVPGPKKGLILISGVSSK